MILTRPTRGGERPDLKAYASAADPYLNPLAARVRGMKPANDLEDECNGRREEYML